MLSAMLVLIFSMVANLSCKSAPKDFPKTPDFTLKQPIIEQQFCDENHANCSVRSFCREYASKDKKTWVVLKDHELKYCHGIFGVNGMEYIEIEDYVMRVQRWIKEHVKAIITEVQDAPKD